MSTVVAILTFILIFWTPKSYKCQSWLYEHISICKAFIIKNHVSSEEISNLLKLLYFSCHLKFPAEHWRIITRGIISMSQFTEMSLYILYRKEWKAVNKWLSREFLFRNCIVCFVQLIAIILAKYLYALYIFVFILEFILCFKALESNGFQFSGFCDRQHNLKRIELTIRCVQIFPTF